jgi:DNA-binding LytR/AlgR family response regulator
MNPNRLTILAVDDERAPLEDLARLLRSCPAVEDVECACDGQDALVKLSTTRYDAIFLDVRMPGLDGLALARVLLRFANPPPVVFVSAYDTAAVDAFELHVLDYLRKPVSRRRVEEALERVVAALEHDANAAPPARHSHHTAPDEERIALWDSRVGAHRLVPRTDVLFAQAHRDVVQVVTTEGRYLVRITLAEIGTRWEPFGFVRVHRQYVANLSRARAIRPLLGGTAELDFGDDITVPVARRHVGALRRRLGV